MGTPGSSPRPPTASQPSCIPAGAQQRLAPGCTAWRRTGGVGEGGEEGKGTQSAQPGAGTGRGNAAGEAPAGPSCGRGMPPPALPAWQRDGTGPDGTGPDRTAPHGRAGRGGTGSSRASRNKSISTEGGARSYARRGRSLERCLTMPHRTGRKHHRPRSVNTPRLPRLADAAPAHYERRLLRLRRPRAVRALRLRVRQERWRRRVSGVCCAADPRRHEESAAAADRRLPSRRRSLQPAVLLPWRRSRYGLRGLPERPPGAGLRRAVGEASVRARQPSGSRAVQRLETGRERHFSPRRAADGFLRLFGFCSICHLW